MTGAPRWTSVSGCVVTSNTVQLSSCSLITSTPMLTSETASGDQFSISGAGPVLIHVQYLEAGDWRQVMTVDRTCWYQTPCASNWVGESGEYSNQSNVFNFDSFLRCCVLLASRLMAEWQKIVCHLKMIISLFISSNLMDWFNWSN